MLAPLVLFAQLATGNPSVPFEKYQLPNGLTVILSEDHRLPQVAVDIWYHVGAANQAPGKSGFAHLFEHMMFSGAKHIGPTPFNDPRGHRHLRRRDGQRHDQRGPHQLLRGRRRSASCRPRSGSRAIAWRSCSTRSTRRSSPCSATSSRTSGARATRTGPTARPTCASCDLLFPRPHPYYDCVIGTHRRDPERVDGRPARVLPPVLRAATTPRSRSSATSIPPQAKALVEKYFGAIPAPDGSAAAGHAAAAAAAA